MSDCIWNIGLVLIEKNFFKSSHSLPPLWSVPVLSIQALYILEYLEDEEEESEESVKSDDRPG